MQQQLLVKYATFDCLSMFDLMMFIYRHYQSNQQQQVKSNESPASQMNKHQEQVAEHTTSQENQQITMTTTSEIKRKRKNKRSIEAKQRRNQKSSIRHRKNRYRFEVIRSLNMDVESAKRILGERNISIHIGQERTTTKRT